MKSIRKYLDDSQDSASCSAINSAHFRRFCLCNKDFSSTHSFNKNRLSTYTLFQMWVYISLNMLALVEITS